MRVGEQMASRARASRFVQGTAGFSASVAGRKHALLGLALALSLGAAGCGESTPSGVLVLTQVPLARGSSADRGVTGPARPVSIVTLDERYPEGTRVVLATAPWGRKQVRVLSKGLSAAGDPVVCPDGQRVLFVGKAPGSNWQVYEARLRGGKPRRLTSERGGVMSPAWLPDGRLLFVSSPADGKSGKGASLPALFAQSIRGGRAERLTFGAAGATDPTVLADGRICFVSGAPGEGSAELRRTGLYTINNDGTEVTAYAGQHDSPAMIRRPRELSGGRLAFLAADVRASQGRGCVWRIESVRSARPFASREQLWPDLALRFWSVEPAADGGWLVCGETRGVVGRSMRGSAGVFRVRADAQVLGEPLFDDPTWDDIEASELAPRPRPMGHLSTMNHAKTTGTILCVDANRSTYPARVGGDGKAASRVRILGLSEAGQVRTLGEAPVHADGSFMVELPADTPLGFETLDGEGEVLRRAPPFLWVRGGENRSCLGCHEPHNRSPQNTRPIAATLLPAEIGRGAAALAQTKP